MKEKEKWNVSKAEFLNFLGEIDSREDDNFQKYRVETAALSKLADFGEKAFIGIGLKGIGKSGAFLSLQQIGKVDLVKSDQPQVPQSGR